jgi:Family of unknown function (DUF6088)
MAERKTKRRSAADQVRSRVAGDGARYWKHGDFDGLPPAAVATELSRLARDGQLQRVGKGVYYRAVPTSFGLSVPGASAAAAETLRVPVHPAGLTAANALGLTTQNPMRLEFATPAAKPPTALRNAIVHTGRPASRSGLSADEGAVLEILRERARSSDLSPEDTIRHLKRAASREETYARLAWAAMSEPPRVRAILGALGQELGMPSRVLAPLRKSLNPLSRFDFGRLRSLRHADEWQAK